MSAKSYLLDASALLAAIHNELGGELVQQIIEESAVSSVNWSEVLQKLNRAGADTQAITAALKALGLEIIVFNEDDATIAASLWPETKSLGLSLADRACLATGRRLKLTVVTADKVWQSLDAEQKIKLIR
ncbi:type II toxin-antitoxin system VapC family toxin [Leucothrix pacifica]|uniref:PIN domain nuclease n=1 Tax=Leucothrix pacifica TaxID=1247513 RepID=A0A317C9X2_9GAMM|nr:type II toxin-antitoxin system VapC family toxin [Leucothrix pacifica]PWQ95404.1 PIN domain nuclease [Leucothrix pacifica]